MHFLVFAKNFRKPGMKLTNNFLPISKSLGPQGFRDGLLTVIPQNVKKSKIPAPLYTACLPVPRKTSATFIQTQLGLFKISALKMLDKF